MFIAVGFIGSGYREAVEARSIQRGLVQRLWNSIAGDGSTGERSKWQQPVVITFRTYCAAKGKPLRLSSTRELFGLTTISASRSKSSLDLRFDVLVQAKEVLRVVLLLGGHESVVGTERGFDRVFPLLP